MIEPTAVEWLYAKMFEKNGRITREEFDQAKEMEKQQIIEFFIKGQNTYPSEYVLDNQQIAEQYYNETFKPE
jgi:hypothetical protein